MNDLRKHTLRISDLDAPIYRVFKVWHFEETLRLRCLWLYPPSAWDDPHETLLSGCAVFDPQRGQQFVRASAAYAQCWSSTGDSDTLLRAYSFVAFDRATGRNLYPGAEGILVQSTPRKLLAAALSSLPVGAEPGSYVIGSVEYHPEDTIYRLVGNALRRYGLNAFMNPGLRTRSLLVKRPAFRFEDEIRLVYVEQRALETVPDRIQVRFQAAQDVFDKVTLDPRLGGLDREERQNMLRARGYNGEFGERGVYQRVLLEVLSEPPPEP